MRKAARAAMPIPNNRYSRSDCPYQSRASTMAAMLCHEADLALRGPTEFVRPRVSWPYEGRDGFPIAVFLLGPGAGQEAADALCTEEGFLVIALRTRSTEVAINAVEWVADHGRQLGGDPDHLVVAGGPLAAVVARHAAEQGWPEIHLRAGDEFRLDPRSKGVR
jgi:hypothetical protein